MVVDGTQRVRRPSRAVAHTPRPGTDDWDDLSSHLLKVARLAASFAEAFGARDLAFLAGLWHDLGKYNPRFQEYLWECHVAERQLKPTPTTRVPHAVWGAVFAYQVLKLKKVDRWQELALTIKGHHAGLANAGTTEADLLEFQEANASALPTMRDAAAALVRGIENGLPSPRFPAMEIFQRELFIRMLLSALVDADRLATEEHGRPWQGAARGSGPTIATLWAAFEESKPRQSAQSAEVKRVRDEVYEACVAAAAESPGLFRLTVPTGGGKTRSGLAFALKHASTRGLCRVIVALPYTSIIEQTAKEYRAILGEHAVLEHHSALDVPDKEEEGEVALRQRLATENWDARIIVTTTVQLLESLLSNSPSRARKLHRVAKSVLILDEIQALPPELLRPTLDVLRILAQPVERGGYGVTVVFCTATQPAFDVGPLGDLFRDAAPFEIVANFEEHYADLRRVTYERRATPLTWEEVADEIRDLRQVMVVLNTRKDTLALRNALGSEEGVFHLSTLLCGAHRRNVLDQVRQCLDSETPVRLISTQVVECGVDLDFPVVYRAVGPLDRIVQVAGRCNRNGKWATGRVVLFEPVEGGAPGGPYQAGIETARLLLKLRGADALHDPLAYREYFQRLYQKVDVDRRKVQDYRAVLDYPEVAKRYRLIDDDTVPVVVPYGEEWQGRLADWQMKPDRRAWRRLQPFLVNLYRNEVREKATWLEPIGDDLYRCPELGYDATGHRGVLADLADPSDLVAWAR